MRANRVEAGARARARKAEEETERGEGKGVVSSARTLFRALQK